MVQDRLDTTAREGGAGAAGSIVVTNLSLTEPDAYDHARGELQLDYFYVLDSKIIGKKAVAASGLWRLIPGSDYSGWARSMKDMRVWSPWGYAGLHFKDSDDLIIDLCLQTCDPMELTEAPVDPRQPLPSKPPFPFPVPKPDQSFIDYQLELIFQPIHGTTELKPLPASPVFYQGKEAAFNAVDGYRSPYAGSSPSVIQYRTNPRWMLTLRGRALRAGYNITPPAITLIAGLTPAPAPGGERLLPDGGGRQLRHSGRQGAVVVQLPAPRQHTAGRGRAGKPDAGRAGRGADIAGRSRTSPSRWPYGSRRPRRRTGLCR